MLRIRLYGGLEVELDGVPVQPPTSRRAWSLLAWLALHPGLSARSRVAACFWPDVLDTSARASLRSAVWAVRRALGLAGDAYLHATRDRLASRAATCGWTSPPSTSWSPAGRLREAAALATGELLAGFDEEWVLQAREEQHAKLTRIFERLAAQAEDWTMRRRRSAGPNARCRSTRSRRNRSAG